jgi:hypothetical protein
MESQQDARVTRKQAIGRRLDAIHKRIGELDAVHRRMGELDQARASELDPGDANERLTIAHRCGWNHRRLRTKRPSSA